MGEIHNREVDTMPTAKDCINQRWERERHSEEHF